jgi:hypothetical protein
MDPIPPKFSAQLVKLPDGKIRFEYAIESGINNNNLIHKYIFAKFNLIS